MISTHHMTNPHKYPRQHGNPPLTRPQQYGAGMDILLQLRNSLAAHGPVLIGGDMNTHASYTDLPLDGGRQDEGRRLRLAQPRASTSSSSPSYQGVRLEQRLGRDRWSPTTTGSPPASP